ncbi:MAG: hypothetical protein ACRD0K_30470 [Egibacteraceae bacterium]
MQGICDRLGPGDIVDFCDRWLDVIPTPLSDRDKDGGYWWECVDAPGRGLPHADLRRASPRPDVL